MTTPTRHSFLSLILTSLSFSILEPTGHSRLWKIPHKNGQNLAIFDISVVHARNDHCTCCACLKLITAHGTSACLFTKFNHVCLCNFFNNSMDRIYWIIKTTTAANISFVLRHLRAFFGVSLLVSLLSVIVLSRLFYSCFLSKPRLPRQQERGEKKDLMKRTMTWHVSRKSLLFC